MKRVRITVLKRTFIRDIAEKYRVKGLGLCELHEEGQVFISNGWEKPEGLYESA